MYFSTTGSGSGVEEEEGADEELSGAEEEAWEEAWEEEGRELSGVEEELWDELSWEL